MRNFSTYPIAIVSSASRPSLRVIVREILNISNRTNRHEVLAVGGSIANIRLQLVRTTSEVIGHHQLPFILIKVYLDPITDRVVRR